MIGKPSIPAIGRLWFLISEWSVLRPANHLQSLEVFTIGYELAKGKGPRESESELCHDT